MSDSLLTLNEASSVSGKSVQTLRRAIKSKKIRVRRIKTPQGFNYMIDKESLFSFYRVRQPKDFREIPVEREQIERSQIDGVQSDEQRPVYFDIRESQPTSTSMSVPDTTQQQAISEVKSSLHTLDTKIEEITQRFSGEREQVGQVLKDFQDRMLIMENQVRLLQAPQKKWYQVWK